MMRQFFAFLAAFFLSFPTLSQATNYYVSNSGDDRADGALPSTPWRTIARVNQQQFHPGDRVLFKGGQTFVGSLYFDVNDSGGESAPVEVSTYNNKAAWIASGRQRGLVAYNTSNFMVSNLYFIGSAQNTTSGLVFFTDQAAGSTNVKLTYVDVSGYGKNGVEVGSWGTRNGFRSFHAAKVRLHHNGDSGMVTYAQYPNSHVDVALQEVTFSFNQHHGLSYGGVNGGRVEQCQAYENGLTSEKSLNSSGFFLYDSTQIVLYNSVARDNHTASGHGGGFDLNQNVSLSTVQYCATYRNDGPGYILAHVLNEGANTDNALQFNTSTDDNRTMNEGAIQLVGNVKNTAIDDNNIEISASRGGENSAINFAKWGIPQACVGNIIVEHNVFHGVPHLVDVPSDILQCATSLRFMENTYQSADFSILWGNRDYGSVAAWFAATGQN
jgi:hypothetical protein